MYERNSIFNKITRKFLTIYLFAIIKIRDRQELIYEEWRECMELNATVIQINDRVQIYITMFP